MSKAERSKKLCWIDMKTKQPEDGQRCLTKMKHGIIAGHYNSKEEGFEGYYWTTLGWCATHWLPIEQAE